jgi:hypothetical protein
MTAAGAVPALGATATAAQKVAVNHTLPHVPQCAAENRRLSLEGADVTAWPLVATWESRQQARLRTMPPPACAVPTRRLRA